MQNQNIHSWSWNQGSGPGYSNVQPIVPTNFPPPGVEHNPILSGYQSMYGTTPGIPVRIQKRKKNLFLFEREMKIIIIIIIFSLPNMINGTLLNFNSGNSGNNGKKNIKNGRLNMGKNMQNHWLPLDKLPTF